MCIVPPPFKFVALSAQCSQYAQRPSKRTLLSDDFWKIRSEVERSRMALAFDSRNTADVLSSPTAFFLKYGPNRVGNIQQMPIAVSWCNSSQADRHTILASEARDIEGRHVQYGPRRAERLGFRQHYCSLAFVRRTHHVASIIDT